MDDRQPTTGAAAGFGCNEMLWALFSISGANRLIWYETS